MNLTRLLLLVVYITFGISSVAYASDDVVKSYQKISNLSGNFYPSGNPNYFPLKIGDALGWDVANLGDLDGDGVEDIAVGANGGQYTNDGVFIFMMNQDGTIKTQSKVTATEGGFTGVLNVFDRFGYSVANLGDLDGDGVVDIAVGAPETDVNGYPNAGAVWILFLNQNGSVKSSQKIASGVGGFSDMLQTSVQFGYAIDGIGDLDGDGVTEIAVSGLDMLMGQYGPYPPGALWILFMNNDGTVKFYKKIDNSVVEDVGNVITNQFGMSVSGIGDLDGDGVEDIVVGGYDDGLLEAELDGGGYRSGAVWVLFLNSDGTTKNYQRISDFIGGFNINLELIGVHPDSFGMRIENVGDIDGDGITDIIAGAMGDDDGMNDTGAVYILMLNEDGTAKRSEKISATSGGFTGLIETGDFFGFGLGKFTDLNGDGTTDIVVSTIGDDDGANGAGALWVLFLNPLTSNTAPTLAPIATQTVSEGNTLEFIVSATDPDNDILTYSASNLPVGATFDAQTQTFSWTPGYSDAGSYDVTFSVTDDGEPVASDSETVTIIVENTNREPALVPIGNQIVSEGDTLQFTILATDPDGDTLTYSASNLPVGATFDAQTQTFSWTPGYSDAGNYTDVEFTVVDNGSPMELAVELITITVGDINRAPTLTNPGPQEVLEDTLLTFTISAVDPDGDAINITASGMPIGSTFDGTTFIWTPSLTQEGVYTITFAATDDGAPNETAFIDVVITVGDNPTPIEQAENIVETVVNLNLPQNIENSYLANLQKVAEFIASGKTQAAINQLQAFVNKIEQDYAHNVLTVEEYESLMNMAVDLIEEL